MPGLDVELDTLCAYSFSGLKVDTPRSNPFWSSHPSCSRRRQRCWCRPRPADLIRGSAAGAHL